MRSVLACASALAAAPLAASHGVVDEVALLQFNVDKLQPGEDTGFTLKCDEVTGCRYHSVEASNTPAPYQLICDHKQGCRYTGITKPAPQNPPRLLSVKGQESLQLAINTMQRAMMGPSKVSPFAGWNMTLAMDNVHKALPGATLPKLPDSLPTPSPVQMAQWKNEYKGAAQPSSKLLAPNASAAKWLVNMVMPAPADLPKMPPVQLHQTRPAQVLTGPPEILKHTKVVAAVPAGVSHFFPDNKMCCVQGTSAYLREKLEKLKASPIGAGYKTAALVDGPCKLVGYVQGPNKDTCFPQASLWMSQDHMIDITSEPRLMAAYAAKHGFASVGKGMAELCKP